MKRLMLVAGLVVGAAAQAHQPVMDMAPRWNNGYGVQTRVVNANDRTTTFVEGVYTFKPSLRMTLKVPFASGDMGDAVFAVPLKKYVNKDKFTSNFGFTPQVRAPTGGGDDWDLGLSVSYSSESLGFYQLYDLYTLDDVLGFDANAGMVFADGEGASLFTLWDVSVQKSDSGERVLSGPVLMYFTGNTIFRAEFKYPVHDKDSAWDGNYLSLGVGVVY